MAKRCATEIQYSRGQDNRRRLYRKLIGAAHAMRAALLRAVKQLTGLAGIVAERWRARVEHYLPLIGRVLDQSQRRVLRGQTAPAGENPGSCVDGPRPARDGWVWMARSLAVMCPAFAVR
jgi:transposase, IS5 family